MTSEEVRNFHEIGSIVGDSSVTMWLRNYRVSSYASRTTVIHVSRLPDNENVPPSVFPQSAYVVSSYATNLSGNRL